MHYMNFVRSGLVVTGLALAAAPGLRGEVIEQIIVKVNGEIVTKTELENRQVVALRQMGQQVNARTDDAQLKQMLDRVTPQLLVSMVDEMLMLQRGKELGYRMADDQFQSVLDSIKKDNNIESEEAFQAALKQENMTLADLRRSLERQMIVSRVQQNEVMSHVAVSDEEARAYYGAHKSEFTSPGTITLREIFINSGGDGSSINVGLDEAARNKAVDVRNRALKGEPFDKLAAEMSDAPSRANAGLIGPLNLADLSPDVQKLVEPMKPGDVTQVLRGPKGYQILKLETATAAETKSFEEAREEISNRVFNDKRKVEFEKFLVRLRAQAIIEWKNKEVQKAYEQGLATAPTETQD
jgi:peptidyl-prolyl cis-trans isomerase SurA